MGLSKSSSFIPFPFLMRECNKKTLKGRMGRGNNCPRLAGMLADSYFILLAIKIG